MPDNSNCFLSVIVCCDVAACWKFALMSASVDKKFAADVADSVSFCNASEAVLTFVLCFACKSTSFNINYDPYTSSLRDVNPKYSSYYSFNRDHDYIIAEVNRVMETRHIEAVSMDHIFQSANVPVPPPDFLSIPLIRNDDEAVPCEKYVCQST